MEVLDLGCGWGSFASFVAEHYPNCRVTAVSNSRTQRAFMEARCDREGWAPVEVLTADAAVFDPGRHRFDRVVSVEMFEHMRNWGALFDRIAAALRPGGAFFQHVFCPAAIPTSSKTPGKATGWCGTSSRAASCRATTCRDR